MKRGEIYYIESLYNEEGSEQRAGRPAIIVSNDLCNESSPVVEVVYLTTQPKNDMPTHVDIRSTQRNSVALCEQISSVSKDRVGSYYATCTDYEMLMVDAALAISLGLNFDSPKSKEKPTTAAQPTIAALPKQDDAELIKVKIERDLYKRLYDEMLTRLFTCPD